MNKSTAYADAGVDVAAGELAVRLLRDRLAAGGPPGDLALTGFGAVVPVPESYRRPLIVASTDGVGTKTDIARRLGRFDTIGQDLVAMCVDDVVCHGARPVYFLDYVAVGRLDPARVAELVGGIGAACAQVGCTLAGGETAEHPGLLEADEFDLAGFCIGFVEADELVDPINTQPGDVVIGLAAAGLHSNGYSLVRRLIDDGRLPLTDELLTPTRLYAPAVLALAAELRARALRLGGLAHVTGGGLARNLARAVGQQLGVRLRSEAWPQPPIFAEIASAAGISGAEMRATFNCGIGFAAVVEPAAEQVTLGLLAAHGIEAWVVGEVRPVGDLAGERYAEE